MTVALLGIYHESNSFINRPTVYEDFENSHLLTGQDIVDEYEDAFHEIGGMIASSTDSMINLVPVYFAEATPGGILSSDTYQRLLFEMLAAFDKIGSIDGVLVVVHGAGIAEGFPDMDGHWLSKVREKVGPSVPIVGTLDPHANVSQLMVDSTNALIAYRTNPHIDQFETGIKAGQLLRKILVDKVEIEHRHLELPLAISIEQQYTKKEPCASLYNLAQTIQNEGGILHLNIFLGFPYADVREMGTSLTIVSIKGKNKASEAADRIKAYILTHKDEFVGEKPNIDDVLMGLDDFFKPILLLDMGDNIGGGAPGNSTWLLDELEKRNISNSCICIVNPEAVLIANQHDVGDSFSISLKDGNELNSDKPYEVHLLAKKHGRFQERSPRHGGQINFDMGKVIILKTKLGNTILLSSLRVPPFSSQQLIALGLEPETFDCIVAKGVNAPIAAYEDICPTILQIDTPGATQADMTRFNYKNRREPLFPFEKI